MSRIPSEIRGDGADFGRRTVKQVRRTKRYGAEEPAGKGSFFSRGLFCCMEKIFPPGRIPPEFLAAHEQRPACHLRRLRKIHEIQKRRSDAARIPSPRRLIVGSGVIRMAGTGFVEWDVTGLPSSSLS